MSVIQKAIKELEGQRARIEAALLVLRTLNGGATGHSRGGNWTMSPEGRKRIAEAQKKRWTRVRAARKAGARKKAPHKKAASTEAAAAASA